MTKVTDQHGEFTVNDLARLTGRSAATVRSWISKGWIPAPKGVYTRSELLLAVRAAADHMPADCYGHQACSRVVACLETSLSAEKGAETR